MAYLIIGNPDDHCCKSIKTLFQRMKKDFVFIDEKKLSVLKCSWYNNGGHIQYNKKIIKLDDVEGILLRITDSVTNSFDDEYVFHETRAAMISWISSMNCPVVNNLPPELWMKEYRSTRDFYLEIFQSGLSIPDNITTDNVDDLNNFLKHNSNGVLLWPLSSFQSFYEIPESQIMTIIKTNS